jgi:RND family efflux transporter MFP subunit
MATQGTARLSHSGLSIALLRESAETSRARRIAEHLVELFPGFGVAVYALRSEQPIIWAALACAGDLDFDQPLIESDDSTLSTMGEAGAAVVFKGSELTREAYSHIHVRRTIAAIAALPLVHDDSIIGAFELVCFDRVPGDADLQLASEVADMAAPALATAARTESERNSQLNSINRLTSLYDLERVFNSTLQMEELLPLVPAKIRDLLNVQAVNLWMIEDGELTLTSRDGFDPTCEIGMVAKEGEGYLGKLAESGEAIFIEDPEDESLATRNGEEQEDRIFSAMAAPLLQDGSLVGALEAINRRDEQPFDDDDLFFLSTICETTSSALHNASLLLAERKVEILQTLVNVSQEITSTLNLERVLKAIVNGPASVVPYERAAIALERNHRLKLHAVSGADEVNHSDPSLKRLEELLEWTSISGEEIFAQQLESGINGVAPEAEAKFQEYFEQTGGKAILAMPLADDQGRLGVLSLESSDPEFLLPVHREMLRIVAAQATIALRNAELYRDVPFIGILEPILQKKQKFMSMERRRRRATVALAAAVVAFLIFCPLPMRVDGTAIVTPMARAQVQPEVDGVVKQVFVHEGEAVTPGTVLGQLEDWDYRSALAAAQAKYGIAVAEMNRALAANDSLTAGQKRIEAEYWNNEQKLAAERLDRTKLRSPIAGIVATPHVENFAGRHLEAGDPFAEIVDSRQAMVDVDVDEQDLALVQAGDKGAIKLDSFPTRSFRGEVDVVSAVAAAGADHRTFAARVRIPNAEGLVRPGMEGRGKVSIGWRPAGYVLFRRTAMWIWTKLWNLAGW